MEIVCSPLGIVSLEYPKQGLKDIAGEFDGAVLDMGSIADFYAYHVAEWRKKRGDRSYKHWIMDNPDKLSEIVRPFVAAYKQHSLSYPLACANFLPYMSGQEEDFGDFFLPIKTLLIECVKTAGEVGVKYLIVRPLAVGVGDRDIWEANREIYLSLAKVARGYGLQILLESQYRIHNGGFVRGLCAEPYEALHWLKELNRAAGYECFGFHMDVGICSLLGQDMREVASTLGKYVKVVTARDCDGLGDSATLPFTSASGGKCRTDWLSLIRGLREIQFDGLMAINFADTASITSPLLKPTLMKYARAVADFLAWQIGMENLLKKHSQRALFGAGNMCRAYMKCYGEKYPPLFTTDNDKSKWGTSFCGLMVKSPEELKNLPKDCAILICNIYYREIERQIKEMGVQNPVGYFNDEYMPQFHFERIEDMKEETDAKAWGTDAERR